MKKYNKPEIVTLALDMVDVIETSAEVLGAEQLEASLQGVKVKMIEQQVKDMQDQWHW